MSIYPEILKRVITNKLNITFSTNTPSSGGLFESLVDFTYETPTKLRTSSLLRYSFVCTGILQTPVEFRDWKNIYDATRHMERNESIVYILLWAYLPKMKQAFADNNDIKTISIAKFRIVDELFLSSYDGKPLSVNSQTSTFSSVYLSEPIRQDILSILQKTQRIYHAFSKVARVYRHKHTPVQINTDLYMNDLTLSNPTTFVLLDHDKIYYFSLNDLAKIMIDSLTYSYMFFIEPKVCKNPYNNVPFTKSTLYNMYFQMKSVFCVVPPLIHAFFMSDFNVFLFKKQNESTLLEHIVREYVAKTEPIHMRAEIMTMISEYDTNRVLYIHRFFPSTSLLKGVKHMFILYLSRKHTQDGYIYQNYGFELSRLMNKFIYENPQFGNMIFKPKLPALAIAHSSVANASPANVPPANASGHVFVFGENRSSTTNTTDTENSQSYTFSNPTPFPYPSFMQFTYETPNVVSSGIPQFTYETPNVVSSGIPQMQIRRFVLNHVHNTEMCSGYNDTVVYKRSPDILLDFLENHQYNEPAYNRYLYSGSIYSVDEPQPLAPSIPDTDSSSSPETGQYQDDESGDEYVIRIHPQANGNESTETLTEPNAITALFQLLSYDGNPSPDNHRTPTFVPHSGVLPQQALLQLQNEPPLSLPLSPLTITEGWTEPGEEDVENDNNTVSTEEERLEQIARENEYIIAGDNLSDMLSIASSIDSDREYDDTDGYDSVS